MCISTKPPAHTLCIDSDRLGYRPWPHHGGIKKLLKLSFSKARDHPQRRKGLLWGCPYAKRAIHATCALAGAGAGRVFPRSMLCGSIDVVAEMLAKTKLRFYA